MNETTTKPAAAPLSRRDAFWGVLCLFVLSMHFWFPAQRPDLPTDSYSTTAAGKKAFVELLEQQDEVSPLKVTRNFSSLSRWTDSNRTPSETALLMLGPQRSPNETEKQALIEWVRRGGTLVWATRIGDPQASLETLNLQIESLDDAAYDDQYEDQSGLVRTRLVSGGDLYWDSDAFVRAPQADKLIEFGGFVQAAIQQVGSGQIVLVAGDFLFTNQSLAWEDNSALAFRTIFARPLLEFQTHGVAHIVVDESLNISGQPKVVGLLVQQPFRPVTIQVLVLVVLFGWWGSRRFGPFKPDPDPPRMNLVDHTDALGTHAWKSRKGSLMVQAYLQQLIHDLKLGGHASADARVLEPTARRLNQPVAKLQKALNQARNAAQTRKLNRNTAAKIIHRLALIRNAANRRL